MNVVSLFNTNIPLLPQTIDQQSPEISSTADGHSGYTPEHRSADTPEALKDACGDAARDFPAHLWIDAKDRKAKAEENDTNRTWAMNFISSYTNQSPTHECTCHDLTRNFVAARNRQRGIIYREGPKANFRYEESSKGDVFMSPLSVYAEANPGRWGGAGCIQVLNIACRRGILPDKVQPKDYGFKHTLQGTSGRGNNNQSGGDWIPIRSFPPGWEETAKFFKPLEVVVTSNWEEALCLLLHGYKISYGRNGHAVGPAMWNVASNAFPYPDSYDVTRVDSFGTFRSAVSGGAYSIISVTTPDDWNEPAKVVS